MSVTPLAPSTLLGPSTRFTPDGVWTSLARPMAASLTAKPVLAASLAARAVVSGTLTVGASA